MRILFVCLGNICRSPTAEGVLREKLRSAGLADAISVESAGTGDWHVGQPPDARASSAAAERGLELGGRARQVAPADLQRFDLILAMDRQNLADLQALGDTAASEPRGRPRVALLRSYDPLAVEAGELDVPDPYYGDGDGFGHVLDVVERACDGLLAELAARQRPAKA